MRGSWIGWGAVVAACVVAWPAGATHHKTAHTKPTHHETTHHEASHHKAPASHHATTHHAKEARHTSHASHEERKPTVAAGATSVSAGGIKLFCGPGKSPLMVRKMTQGAGTTVTVICR